MHYSAGDWERALYRCERLPALTGQQNARAAIACAFQVAAGSVDDTRVARFGVPDLAGLRGFEDVSVRRRLPSVHCFASKHCYRGAEPRRAPAPRRIRQQGGASPVLRYQRVGLTCFIVLTRFLHFLRLFFVDVDEIVSRIPVYPEKFV